jgi:hypothetical protein
LIVCVVAMAGGLLGRLLAVILWRPFLALLIFHLVLSTLHLIPYYTSLKVLAIGINPFPGGIYYV